MSAQQRSLAPRATTPVLPEGWTPRCCKAGPVYAVIVVLCSVSVKSPLVVLPEVRARTPSTPHLSVRPKPASRKRALSVQDFIPPSMQENAARARRNQPV